MGVLVGYAGLQMIEPLNCDAISVIPDAHILEHYLDVWEHHQAGDRDDAPDKHAELLPLIDHLIQDIEGFIHYEKRMLAAKYLIDLTARASVHAGPALRSPVPGVLPETGGRPHVIFSYSLEQRYSLLVR